MPAESYEATELVAALCIPAPCFANPIIHSPGQSERHNGKKLGVLTACFAYFVVFGAESALNCDAARQFPVKWPLGNHVLRAQLAAIADSRLFAYQQPFIDDLGPVL